MATAASLNGSVPVDISKDKQLPKPVSATPPEPRVLEITRRRFSDEDFHYAPPRRGFCNSSTYVHPSFLQGSFQRKLGWIL